MLYYDNEYDKNDEALTEYRICRKPRYLDHNTRTSNRKTVPNKGMLYFLVILRLQRMFASMQTTGKMTWLLRIEELWMCYVIRLMVKSKSTLIKYIQILPWNHTMCVLVYALMDLTHIFKRHLYFIPVGQ